MSDQPFVHLHVHTEYSLLDGLSDIHKLVDHAKSLDMTALAITDHGVMFGAMEFYTACKKAGIKPIIGMEGYLSRRRMTDRDAKLDAKPYHMLMLAQNTTGYKNLLKIASAAQLEGYYYKPRVDREFLEAHKDGLIVTSGCLAAQIPALVMEGRDAEARDLVDWYLQVFGRDNFYLELQDHDIPELKTVNDWLIDIGKKDQIRFLATNDVHYVNDIDYDPHDTLLCIQTGAMKHEKNRMQMTDNSYFLRDRAQMWSIFGHIDGGAPLLNTVAVAEMCDLDLDRKAYHLPKFPVPNGHTAQSYMTYLAKKGMEWRYGVRADADGLNVDDAQLLKRLQYELTVIGEMGFATYFLIVWDLCEFARAADIWWNVRGSGAGSMVAYCLGITNIDPIQNNLIFERFLNPGRVSMPDIDLDYPDDRRADMIAYTTRKYGEDKVAAIITFGTMGAKAAVRDVGRALGMDLSLVNAAARLIPTEPKPKKIPQYIEDNPELKAMVAANPDLRLVMDTATTLQGVSRHASTHAAGVIVADAPLVEYLPLHRQTKGNDDNNPLKQVTQFPMETCEAIGLLKVDFLGLSTLTYLRRAADLIHKHRGIRYTMDNIPYRPNGDPGQDRMLEQAFEMVSRGETIGVFQVESSGMQQMLRDMRPTRFEHIIAGISLYRPGPMDFIPTYNRRMHGEEAILYHHPKLEPILAETYSIIVYQEQLMQIASALFGYSLGDADLMRRAVSKKKKEDLLRHKAIFLENGPKNGVDLATAEKIFDEIEFFANYGFNKSHAADYAVLTVQTAFLKTHYPEEYMAALLSVYYDDAAKVTTFLGECKRMNIPILPPDANSSELDFDIQTDRKTGRRGIRFGLAAIKNVGVGALQHILDARADGAFTSLDDFCQRVDLRAVSKRALECLIKVGALDSLKAGTRPQLLHAVDRIISHSTEKHKAKTVGQMGLFGDVAMESDDLLHNLPKIEEATTRQQLDWERELMGLFISSHPIDPMVDALRGTNIVASHELKDPESPHNGKPVRYVGMVAALRKMPTKQKEMMAVASLEDRFGAIDAVFFPRKWKEFEHLVTDGSVIIVSGKLDLSRGDPQIICESATNTFEAVVRDSEDSIGEVRRAWEIEETLPPAPHFSVVEQADFGAPAPEELDWMRNAPDPYAYSVVQPSASNGTSHNGLENITPHTTLPQSVPDIVHSNGSGLEVRASDPAGRMHSAPTPADGHLPVHVGEMNTVTDWSGSVRGNHHDDFDDDVIDMPPEPPKIVTVFFQRNGDDQRDQRRIQRVVNTLRQNPGQDHFQVIVVEEGRSKQRWDFDGETTSWGLKLQEELARIVGIEYQADPLPGSVLVKPS